MGDFADSIKANIANIKQDISKELIHVAASLFKDVVGGTPSPTDITRGRESPFSLGLISNQWYPAYNKKSGELTSSKDDVGFNSLERIMALQGGNYFLGKDGTLTLTNNVPYANQVESIGWRSTPPYAMVYTALIRAKARMR